MSADVYLHFGKSNEVLYVGMTTRAFKRQEEHAASKPWWPSVCRIECIHLADRQAALDTEKLLIRILRPMHNVVHNGGEVSTVGLSAQDEFALVTLERAEAGAYLLASEARVLRDLRAKRDASVPKVTRVAGRVRDRLAS